MAILPSVNVPKGGQFLPSVSLMTVRFLFKLLPRALKQHVQLLPREASNLPHPSHWGNTQTQPFLM